MEILALPLGIAVTSSMDNGPHLTLQAALQV